MSTLPTSVRFTEEMKGHVTLEETDFRRGAGQGRADGTFLMFHLTIEIPDIDAFHDDPLRRGTCQGYVGCEVLGGDLPVELGEFNLFVDQGRPSEKRMRYRLWFRDRAGHPLTLTGFKVVADHPGFDVWTDTSTLYTRVLRGHLEESDAFPSVLSPDAPPPSGPAGDIVASGIITIWKRDFLRQLTTFRSSGPSWRARLSAVADFGAVFVRQLGQVYLRKAA
jgi:cholesterol oxidase